jgi:Domain of unknown function (DUF4783)
MKTMFLMLGLSLMIFSFTTQGDVDDIIKGFKNANAEQISNHFEGLIDLTLPGKDEIKNIGKNQATIALRTFFEENAAKSFDVTSQRETGGTLYIAGKLVGKNKTYNVTIWLKNKDSKYFIASIRMNAAQ